MKDLKLAEPTARIKIGARKVLRVKRAQDVIEIIAWATVMAQLVMFLVDGGLKEIVSAGGFKILGVKTRFSI